MASPNRVSPRRAKASQDPVQLAEEDVEEPAGAATVSPREGEGKDLKNPASTEDATEAGDEAADKPAPEEKPSRDDTKTKATEIAPASPGGPPPYGYYSGYTPPPYGYGYPPYGYPPYGYPPAHQYPPPPPHMMQTYAGGPPGGDTSMTSPSRGGAPHYPYPPTSPMAHHYYPMPHQGHPTETGDNHGEDEATKASDNASPGDGAPGGTNPNLKVWIKPNLPLNQDVMNRRARKNAQSRARAAKIKLRILDIEAKAPEERDEEERALLLSYENRRGKKNNRSRERALEKKVEIDRILSKPEAQRTKIENQFLENALTSKKRKNEGDRLRRSRLKAMGMPAKGSRLGRGPLVPTNGMMAPWMGPPPGAYYPPPPPHAMMHHGPPPPGDGGEVPASGNGMEATYRDDV